MLDCIHVALRMLKASRPSARQIQRLTVALLRVISKAARTVLRPLFALFRLTWALRSVRI